MTQRCYFVTDIKVAPEKIAHRVGDINADTMATTSADMAQAYCFLTIPMTPRMIASGTKTIAAMKRLMMANTKAQIPIA